MTAHNTYDGRCSECGTVLSHEGGSHYVCGACGVPVRVWVPPADIEARIEAAMERAEREYDAKEGDRE